MRVALALLYERSDARRVDDAVVSSIAGSMADVGQINPIRVRPCRRYHMGQEREAFEIVAGVHRVRAAQSLQWQDIEAAVVSDDDLKSELAMIDENLCRAELSPSDRARQTARRKAIYEEMNPETRQGAVGRGGYDEKGGQLVHSFADATADATGRDARSVRRDAERGEKVIDEVLDMIGGTKLDTGSYLDKLKKLPPAEQIEVVKRDLASGHQKTRSGNGEGSGSSRRSNIDNDVKDRATREAAEIIAEHVPAEAWDGLKANLYASGAKALADALTNITGNSVMDRGGWQ